MRRRSDRRQSPSVRRGALLVIAMIALLIAISLCSLLVRSAVQFRRQQARDGRHLQADWIAEAAAVRGLRQLALSPDYTGEQWTVELPETGVAAKAAITVDRAEQRVIADVELEPRGPAAVRSRSILAIPKAIPDNS